MANMSQRDRTRWAKEEIADALKLWLKERVKELDMQDDLSDEIELKKQVERILKRLG